MHHYWYGNEIISTLIKLENDRIVCIQQAKIIVRCHVKQKNNPTNFDPAHRCTTSNTKPHTQSALLWIPNPADFPIYKLLEELWSYCNYPAVLGDLNLQILLEPLGNFMRRTSVTCTQPVASSQAPRLLWLHHHPKTSDSQIILI